MPLDLNQYEPFRLTLGDRRSFTVVCPSPGCNGTVTHLLLPRLAPGRRATKGAIACAACAHAVLAGGGFTALAMKRGTPHLRTSIVGTGDGNG